MKILTIIGNRPQCMKIDPDLPNQVVCFTGQHYDKNMSTDFFDELDIKPKYNLKCRNKVGRMIDKLVGVLAKEKPDMVIVIGDTNSTLAGALAAAHQNIPVAHVEAGLRSFRRNMPEEMNRVIVDHISHVLFCPNATAATNLLKEGITKNVHIVGDPEFDTLIRFTPIKRTKNYRRYNLVTIHRNFNTDIKENLTNIIEALKESGKKFIFPLHPRTRNKIEQFKISIPKNIKLIEPQPYRKTLELIANADKVITDSGGVQREAYWLNTPVIIVRDETEWPEIIANGAGLLVGTDKIKLLEAIKHFKGHLNPPPVAGANKKIRDILYKYL